MPEPYRIEIPFGVFYAPVQLSATGTVVSGVVGRRIILLSASIIASLAVNVKWQTLTGPTDLSGFAYLAQNGGYILPFNPGGWTQTLVGDSLLFFLSGGIPVGGMISYTTA